MDEQRLRSFLLARGLLDRAQASLDGSAPGAMACVVLYDLGVETGAKATAAVHRPTGFPGSGGYRLTKAQRGRIVRGDPSLPAVLDELLAAAREASGNDELDVGEIRGAARLHELRNLIQHDASVPSPEQIETSRARAFAFLAWLTEAFFGMELERLSRASLVHSETVRTQIERAETLASSGEWDQAAEALAIAFEFARIEFRVGESYETRRRWRRSDVSGALSVIRQADDDPIGRGYRNFKDLVEGFAAEIELIADRVEALTIGARASEYEWFRRNFPAVHRLMSAEEKYGYRLVTISGHEGVTRDIYERGREFVIDAALHWQQFPVPGAAVEEGDEGV